MKHLLFLLDYMTKSFRFFHSYVFHDLFVDFFIYMYIMEFIF